MPDGPGCFGQDSSCPGLLRVLPRTASPRVRGFHPLRPRFPSRSASFRSAHAAALLPRSCRNMRGLGSSPVARRYWGNHSCFLLLRVLRCFISPRSPPLRDGAPPVHRVAPFGHPRIIGHLHLPAAFRSLSRPSSPPGAKASTVRPCSVCLLCFFSQNMSHFSFQHVKERRRRLNAAPVTGREESDLPAAPQGPLAERPDECKCRT